MLKSFTKSVSKYAQFMLIIGLVYANSTALIEDFNPKKLIPNISPGRIGIHKHILGAHIRGLTFGGHFVIVFVFKDL